MVRILCRFWLDASLWSGCTGCWSTWLLTSRRLSTWRLSTWIKEANISFKKCQKNHMISNHICGVFKRIPKFWIESFYLGSSHLDTVSGRCPSICCTSSSSSSIFSSSWILTSFCNFYTSSALVCPSFVRWGGPSAVAAVNHCRRRRRHLCSFPHLLRHPSCPSLHLVQLRLWSKTNSWINCLKNLNNFFKFPYPMLRRMVLPLQRPLVLALLLLPLLVLHSCLPNGSELNQKKCLKTLSLKC